MHSVGWQTVKILLNFKTFEKNKTLHCFSQVRLAFWWQKSPKGPLLLAMPIMHSKQRRRDWRMSLRKGTCISTVETSSKWIRKALFTSRIGLEIPSGQLSLVAWVFSSVVCNAGAEAMENKVQVQVKFDIHSTCIWEVKAEYAFKSTAWSCEQLQRESFKCEGEF